MQSGWIFWIGVALFATYGFCCMLHAILDFVFTSNHYWITIKVKDEKDADMLDMLLHEADSAFFRKRGERTVVLISSALFANGVMGSADGILHDAWADLLDRYGAECYVMEWDSG